MAARDKIASGTEPGTVSMRLLHPLLSYFRSVHREVTPLLTELALQLQEVLDPEGRIAEPTLLALCRRIAEVTKDRAVGLHAVAQIDLGALPLLLHGGARYPVIQTLVASPTLGEGLQRFCKFYPLAHDSARFVIRPSRAGIRVCLLTEERSRALDPLGSKIFIEYAIAVLLHVVRGLTVPSVVPLRVFLAQPEPEESARYAAHFGAPVTWEEKADGFVLAKSQLETPLRSANPIALSRLEERLAELEAMQATKRTLAGQVKAALATGLRAQGLSAGRVARGLGMSVRTLTRRLQAEGTSYQKLLDEIRSELASRYLFEDRLPSEQVAVMLGFSETSALLRAFRRWHGRSLTEYRRKRADR